MYTGLSQKEANERLRKEGYNELPYQKKQNVFVILFNVIREPMLMLLVASGIIYLILGEPKDALMLLTFVFVVVGITFYQERKTEMALEALKNLSSPRALVIRGGEQIRISGQEVVRDDIIVLREGDRVPADGTVISSTNLAVDESLLTGESLAVSKSVWDGRMEKKPPGGDDLPFVYSGTLVIQGRGIARVTEIGIFTRMGKIGRALETIKEEDTLLKKEIDRLVRNFALVGVGLCIIVVLIYGLVKGNFLNGFLAGLTLSMAMLPEEFPVVLLIFLTLGAWRMSKRKVLTRHTAAIETLGAAKVLCVDKTGTITLNKMQLRLLVEGDKQYELPDDPTKIPESHHRLIEYAILSSQKDPFDPIEKEIKKIGELLLTGTEHVHKNWKLVREYPLSKKLLALSHVWQSPDRQNYIIAAKGAPEAIADLCHLSKNKKEQLLQQIKTGASQGLRLIAVSCAVFKKSDLPKEQHDFVFELIGLLCFADPVRSSISSSIAECYRAGIRVCMITGDYPGTAQFIAKKIGLKNPQLYLTGEQLEKLDHLQLREKIKQVNLFARVAPEQKLLIVNALKANGEVVAMTGDGVNDAPALKSAHIGISMGERGTDVAREASDLVLLNDDFSSIVAATRLGRRIFDNLKKAIAYIFAVHVPIAGMSFLPILFNLPVVLLPAHIAFLELIIDPACSIVFESEPEEAAIMDRPPRNLREPLFDKKTLIISLMQGLSVLTIVFLVFIFVLNQGRGEGVARTITFVTLVFANLMLIITNLSWRENVFKIISNKNQALWWVLIGTIVFLSIVIFLPVLQSLFHFSPLGINDLLIAIIASIFSVGWFEGLKIINNQLKAR